MVRKPLVSPGSSSPKSPEDASMHNGIFHENNTHPPSSHSIKDLFSLRGKTAIVTGAGAGIGLQVAHALAEAGADVAIWYHGNREAIDRAREIAKAYNVKCKAYQTDVTSHSSIASTISTILNELNGRLDIFVANAGIPWTQGRMIDGERDHYRKVISTDLDSVFYCAQAAGEVFRRQYTSQKDVYGRAFSEGKWRGGSFVATASMSAHIANIPQLQSAYNAAKAGVIQLAKSLAVEWVRFARVNSVSPGYVATEISRFIPPETKKIWRGKIPMGREAEASELKGIYLFLASEASSYITGSDFVIDGGYTAV
ncbi:NAD(P)-binding protein [Piedraia hortae CBS 480.64]|uniref:NADP-dependent mannitol dehydrogenase n=1 Tax=Piedraia hortae CBS 480.64 TaxID=1314780 RepID=A0A6A7BTQ8_9PEZI|nr:NAD(P)-binding protein [Piedraia hortae CBS 480.64]